MRLLKGAAESGALRWLDGKAADQWRENVISHLNSTDRRDRGRYRYGKFTGVSDAEPVTRDEFVSPDTAVLEKATPQKPEEPRVVVDQMVRDTVDQWLTWRRTDPDLFHRKVEEAMVVAGWGHMTVEQAADQIVALCRKIEEADAQATYETRKIGGGWRGPVILGE